MIGGPVVAVVAAVLFLSSPAVAHSLLLESSPAAEATLAAPPSLLTLRFNNRIEKALSRITLVDERGTPRALAITVADEGADRLSAAVPTLTPGTYRVEWQVLSTDGHVVSGGFGFRLAR